MRCSPTETSWLGFASGWLAVLGVILAAAPAGAEIALTVYNDNLGLVREERALELGRGETRVEITDVPAQIDPTSVHFRSLTAADRAVVLEQNFVYDLVDGDRLLERYLDQRVQVYTRQGGSFSGVLRSFAGGSLVVSGEADDRTTIVTRSEVESVVLTGRDVDLVTRPTLVWLLQNDGPAAQQVQIEYLTSGISWHAEYTGVLDEDESALDLAAWVSLDNRSGKTYEDASLKVVAGSIHRAPSPQPALAGRPMMMAEAARAPGFESREFFEYHLYSLQRRTTVRDRETKQLSLFPNVRTAVEKHYTYDTRRDAERVEVSIVFQNRADAGLGMALPGGVIRLYKDDGDGGVGLVGEDRLQHVPKDEEVEVVVGKAFDIVAERAQTESRKISTRSREDSYEIKFRNHKSTAVQIDVKEPTHGDWTIVRSSHSYEKKDVRTVRFDVSIPADGETVLSYTILTSW